jgi:hypothetical protein
MGLIRRQRVGEGMHYIPLGENGLDLTIKLLEIRGPKNHRRVTFTLSGLGDFVYAARIFSGEDKLLVAGHRLAVGLIGREGTREEEGVPMNYSAPRDLYRLERIEFGDAEEPDHKYP